MGISVVSPVAEVIRLACVRSPRVLLVTDAASAESVPESIRSVVEETQYGSLSAINGTELSSAFDGALVWCKGETPASGTAAEWRRPFFSRPDANISVAVHWPYLEHADLVGLEPRFLRKPSAGSTFHSSLHIAGASPSDKRKAAWRASGKPWAQLSLALWRELEKPGSGLDMLSELWTSNPGDSRFSALVLRSLILVLIKSHNWPKAGELLNLGITAFPACADFPYLQAVCFLQQKTAVKAVRFLEMALNCTGREFVGSGGESSYRARYLLGLICDSVGQQEKAVNYWLPGAIERPAFVPSVRALTQQRFPRGLARWLHQPLAEMVRREPQHLEVFVNFLVLNDMALAAERLVETMPITKERSDRLLDLVHEAQRGNTPRPRDAQIKPGILLTGPILDASGHSRINCALGRKILVSTLYDAALDPTTWPTVSCLLGKCGETISRGLSAKLDRVDLTIRHQWPPNFMRPKTGKLACILPWEHRAVPVGWIDNIESNVDALWTPSEFTRQALVEAGVSPERLSVVPNAVDPEIFRPDGTPTRPATSKGFIFLFVGGCIRRKGIDLLLQAYADAFMPEEDVTLVVKDLGSRSFYRHNTQLAEVLQFAARRTSPHTLVLTEEMDDSGLAALYRGADALVLPYRAEGFGMPLIEAMACGKPVITTEQGPAIEFCSEKEAYLIPAKEVEVPEPPPQFGPLSSEWTWFEPSVAALAKTLRHVYENRNEAVQRGKKAAHAMRLAFTWKTILPMYLEKIERLAADALRVPQSL